LYHRSILHSVVSFQYRKCCKRKLLDVSNARHVPLGGDRLAKEKLPNRGRTGQLTFATRQFSRNSARQFVDYLRASDILTGEATIRDPVGWRFSATTMLGIPLAVELQMVVGCRDRSLKLF
jgi:hypothetical protein